MAKLLHIQASPRQRSRSAKVARAFIESYQASHPDDTVETLNIFEKQIPAFDGLAVQAKYSILHGKQHSPEERRAWTEVENMIAEFKEADKYLFSVPMWNFSIPYRLKQYFDIIVQPGYTFTAGENGYQGLITNKPAIVIYARGGAYPAGSQAEAFDLQKRYMEQILGFIGFEKFESIFVEPTLAGEEETEKKVQACIAKAVALAKDF